MTSQQTTRDTYSSRQMATAYSFDVDTSNCKAMISMIKATRFFIKRGSGPNRFTRQYLSNFFKVIH